MRRSLFVLAAALAGAGAPTAYGQYAASSSGNEQVAYEYDSYYSQEDAAKSTDEKSPAPAAPQKPVAAEQSTACGCEAKNECGCSGGCSDQCGCCDCCSGDCCDSCLFPCCKHGDAWKLFDCPCSKIKWYGFWDQGFTWNPQNPTDRFNGPVTFNDRANEYQMNQLYLIGEKTLDTKCGWDYGGRLDLLYGTDSRFTLAAGLDAHDNGSPRWNSGRFYGLAMPQVYGEVGYEDLSVKVGHFYTIIGYEVVMANGGFFYSHAYTHQYGEPFTHTGALATYKLNEQAVLYGGITRGWDNWNDPNGAGALLTGITLNDEEKKNTLAFALTNGNEANFFNGANSNRYMQSIVYTRALSDKLKYVFETDYGLQNGSVGAPDAEWYGVNQYLFRTINECWAWGIRAEWFRDDDGTRVAPVGDFMGSNTASVGGFAGNFYEITFGFNWKPNANWVFRPEIRYDWFDGDALNGVQPYDDGTKDDQLLLAIDAIVTY